MTFGPNAVARLVAGSDPMYFTNNDEQAFWGSAGGYKCGLCNKKFKHSTFAKHLKDVHLISWEYAQSEGMIAYSDEKYGMKAYVCDACEEGYYTTIKGNFKRHCENCEAAAGVNPIFELRDVLIYKSTNHFAGLLSEAGVLQDAEGGQDTVVSHGNPRILQMTGSHARVDHFVRSYQSIHRELTEDFGVTPKLALSVEALVTAVTNGISLFDFASISNERMVSPLPPVLAETANEWLRVYARPLSKIVPGKVLAAMVTFKMKTEDQDDKIFKMWENQEVILTELKQMLSYLLGVLPDSSLSDVNHPIDLCRFVIDIAVRPAGSNTHSLPPLSHYIVFRYVKLTEGGPKFRNMWFLSSVIARVMHIVRLAGITLCSTFEGEQAISKQMELCGLIQDSHLMQIVGLSLARIRHTQNLTPGRIHDEVTEGGDVFCSNVLWKKQYVSRLVPDIREKIVKRLKKYVVDQGSIDLLLRMDARVKRCVGGISEEFTVNDIHCSQLFEIKKVHKSDDQFVTDMEKISSYIKLACHTCSNGVRRNTEVPVVNKLVHKFVNDYLLFWATCHKVPGVGVINTRLIEHRLPWSLGRLCLLMMWALKQTNYVLKEAFDSMDAAKELFHLEQKPSATDLRNAITQFANEVFGLNSDANVDQNELESYFRQTGHTRRTHEQYYHTNKAYSAYYEGWHMFTGEIKYVRKESQLTMKDIQGKELKSCLDPQSAFEIREKI